MILKDLQEKYSVLKNNGEYQIYDKTIGSGKYLNIRYLCNLEKVGSDKYKIVPSKHFDGVCSMNTFLPTKDIEILSSCILEYVNSLRFHSDCYCPSYRDNVFFRYIKQYKSIKHYTIQYSLYALIYSYMILSSMKRLPQPFHPIYI